MTLAGRAPAPSLSAGSHTQETIDVDRRPDPIFTPARRPPEGYGACLTPRVSHLRCSTGVRRYPRDRDTRLRTGEHHRPGPRCPAGCTECRRSRSSEGLYRVRSADTVRPGLGAMLDHARAGDTVVVSAIDRLGRSVAEVTRTIAELGDRQSRCAPYGKEWTPVPRPGVRWRRLWLLSLSLNSNSVVSAAPHPWIPPRPTPAGDQTAQAHPRTARSVAPPHRDRRTSPRTYRGVRGRTGDRVPLPITVWRQL